MKIRSMALTSAAILLLSLSVQPAHAAKTPKPITSLQDAVKRPKDVSYWAWKKSSDQVLSNSEKSGELVLIVGPNTKLSNPNPKLAFDAVKRQVKMRKIVVKKKPNAGARVHQSLILATEYCYLQLQMELKIPTTHQAHLRHMSTHTQFK